MTTFKSEIGNQKSKIVEWLTRPGSQQLGAKWVEVTTRRAQGVGLLEDESEFENVASNTR